MQGAGQTGGPGADDQDVSFKCFTLNSHRLFSLAERARLQGLVGVPGMGNRNVTGCSHLLDNTRCGLGESAGGRMRSAR
jgi:hypothetical protein